MAPLSVSPEERGLSEARPGSTELRSVRAAPVRPGDPGIRNVTVAWNTFDSIGTPPVNARADFNQTGRSIVVRNNTHTQRLPISSSHHRRRMRGRGATAARDGAAVGTTCCPPPPLAQRQPTWHRAGSTTRILVPEICPTIAAALACAQSTASGRHGGGGSGRTEISLAAGRTFREKVVVPSSAGAVTLLGRGSGATIVWAEAGDFGPAGGKNGTLVVHGPWEGLIFFPRRNGSCACVACGKSPNNREAQARCSRCCFSCANCVAADDFVLANVVVANDLNGRLVQNDDFMVRHSVVLPRFATKHSLGNKCDRSRKQALYSSFWAGYQSGKNFALHLLGDRMAAYRCRFFGKDDMLYSGARRLFVAHSVVNGSTDFLFGAGSAVFENCTVLAEPGRFWRLAGNVFDCFSIPCLPCDSLTCWMF